ncbi:MAG: 23S rRNA (guanosine(2251)-2'-O)-methyltransferase RlmB [Christensenellales bacterium]
MTKAMPQQPAQDDRELPLILYGRNPVREAIKSGRSIDRILVTAAGVEDGSLRELVRMARDAGIVVSEVTRQKLDEMTLPYGYAGKPANHQGIIARMPECQYVGVEDILAQARERGEAPFVILLDSINDPHNLGSIMRSALCAGAHGVIIPKRRAASVTAAAGKASAGAVAYLPVARVANLSNTVEMLKKEGLWICGADAEGKPMSECDMKGPLALVIGSEDEGISRILREKCDFLASIPMKGPLDSLNASVAAAVLMFEKVRQDAGSTCT